jgi:hypothetical protein
MRIGIDFDNTIACYDGVFYRAAVERGLIPSDLRSDKTSVRNYLRAAGREDDWTELQGYIYGARMDLVSCYPGVRDFLRLARDRGHTTCVISHKTRYPYRGERHDLHAASLEFLRIQGILGSDGAGIDLSGCYFELTLAEKLARIREQACDVFIDDLPEFLAERDFPAATRPILFDPYDHYPDERRLARYATWPDIADALLDCDKAQ